MIKNRRRVGECSSTFPLIRHGIAGMQCRIRGLFVLWRVPQTVLIHMNVVRLRQMCANAMEKNILFHDNMRLTIVCDIQYNKNGGAIWEKRRIY